MKKNKISFQTFDEFIIQQMNCSDRVSAYQKFYQTLDKTIQPASIPTMKRWFGIDGHAMPSREQIFILAFSLKLSPSECEIYLTRGLWQPAFQINDYQETVYLYGLENQLPFEQCQMMMEDFEASLEGDIHLSQTHSTQELMTQYQHNKHLPYDEFFNWMLENASYFKGYSHTALNYMTKYQDLIIQSAREDALSILKRELAETEYPTWRKYHFLKNSESDAIKNFLYKHMKQDPEHRDQLLYLTKLAYYTETSNIHLIRELFSGSITNAMNPSSEQKKYPAMTEKRMSDLLSAGLQRERLLQAKIIAQKLKDLKVSNKCPDVLKKQLHKLGIYNYDSKNFSVREAISVSEKFLKSQKHRCLLIQRSDLLPMIYYMVERDYIKQISGNMEKYSREDALTYFVQIANSTLSACNMALLNYDYLPDSLIYQCFQENELHSLSDIIEVIEHT